MIFFFILGAQTFPTIRIFNFGSQALLKHNNFYIWFTSNLGNMAVFILGSQALPKT